MVETVALGNSDLEVSRIGCGGCPLGGHGWGKVDEKELDNTVSTALDTGITLFDTADVYGLGRSEERLGKVLKNRRSEVIVSSKFGVRRKGNQTFFDNSPDWIAQALEASLYRLQTDYIDLYQLHYWDGKSSFDNIFETLERFREQGKIRYYGVTNVSWETLGYSPRSLPQGFVSCSFEFNLFQRKHEESIKNFIEQGPASFLSWGSLCQGLLGGNYGHNSSFPEEDRRSRDTYVNFHGNLFKKNLGYLKALKQRFSRPDTLAQISLRWILDRFPESIALVGMKQSSQARENAKTLSINLSDEELGWLANLLEAPAN